MSPEKLFQSACHWSWESKEDHQWSAYWISNHRSMCGRATLKPGFLDRNGTELSVWSFGFFPNRGENTPYMNGGGDQFRIMTTSWAILLDFMKQRQPETILINAVSSELNRVSLYRRITERLSGVIQEMGYQEIVAPKDPDPYMEANFSPICWRLTSSYCSA